MLSNKQKTALTHDDVLTVIDKIDKSQTINALLNDVTDVMGVTATSYHHFAAVGSFDFRNMSRFYSRNIPRPVAKYFNDDARLKTDPGLLKAFTTGSFAWLSDFIENADEEDNGFAARLEGAIDFVGDGLCIPLYGPNNRHGYMFVSFGRHKNEFDPILSYQIQNLAQRLHVRYCLMRKGLQKQVKLTSREAEVLELISFGKTNPEIAKILNISPNTVAGHVKRIFLKLDTNDRVTAAMRAQSLKLVL